MRTNGYKHVTIVMFGAAVTFAAIGVGSSSATDGGPKEAADLMISIKVLGAQCSNCKKLYEAVKQAVQSLGVEANLEKVTDYQEMMRYGLMQTPGLVIEEKLVAAGRIPPMSELVSMIATALAIQG